MIEAIGALAERIGALFPDEALGVRLTVSMSDHDAYGTGDRSEVHR